MKNKDEIIKLVNDNSYFDYEGNEDGLQFSTRKNGSVSSETASNIDIREAKKVRDLLLLTYKKINVKIEVVDEWVLIFVTKQKKVKQKFTYTFLKRSDEGNGFGETIKKLPELIKKYKGWLDIDWNKVEADINAIDKFPHEIYGGFQSDKYVLALAGAENNKWGYNLYIVKNLRT